MKLSWKKETNELSKKVLMLKLELEEEFNDFCLQNLTAKEVKEIKERIRKTALEHIADNIAASIGYDYEENIRDAVASEMLKGTDIKKLINERQIQIARDLLRGY